MKKSMTIMLISVGVLFGAIFAFKWLINQMIHKKVDELVNAKPTVSSSIAKSSLWQHEIQVVGNVRTTKGVDITTELGGMIRDIYFKPGSEVTKGTLLVQLDIDPDLAKLAELKAKALVAKTTYLRNLKQYKIGGISKETLDRNEADDKSAAANVLEQEGNIAKKTIRAPFSGRLGISAVNIGQYLNPGDKIVTIETLKPIWVDFYLPQQEIPSINIDMPVSVSLDTYPNHRFLGNITTINPIVDSDVRNIEVEATLSNDEEKILPGMFVYVTIKTGEPRSYITLPQMAVSFNPYGAIVYTLSPTTITNQNKKVWKVTQQFVTTGDTRGTKIAILKGIKAGDRVVTSGQLKIRQGSEVILNDQIQPE
jgi:membrane fusion protein (multidrug efflux system)